MILDRFKVPTRDQVRVSEAALRRTVTQIFEALGEPYPGLRSFRRDETHIFFGREKQIDVMVDRLGHRHFLAVVGASGSGKSSLVRAGLLEALEMGLLSSAGPVWHIADLRPRDSPRGSDRTPRRRW